MNDRHDDEEGDDSRYGFRPEKPAPPFTEAIIHRNKPGSSSAAVYLLMNARPRLAPSRIPPFAPFRLHELGERKQGRRIKSERRVGVATSAPALQRSVAYIQKTQSHAASQ